jgi:hypothetical protein
MQTSTRLVALFVVSGAVIVAGMPLTEYSVDSQILSEMTVTTRDR